MRSFLFILATILVSWSGAAQEGFLLYSGLTQSNGWQIFRYDLQTKATTQLSQSPGDKRSPQYSAAHKAAFCRDSLGRIVKVSGSETLYSESLAGCMHYSISPDGKAVYFTRPGGKLRQDIWKQAETTSAPVVAVAVPEGMLKQVTVSPDGKAIAATHIWRVNEERLIFTPLKNVSLTYLTTDKSMDAFPFWSGPSTILFASVQPHGSYGIDEIDIVTKEKNSILAKAGTNYCSPVCDESRRFLFVEERQKQGSSIVCYDRKNNEFRKLSIPHQSREPFWYNEN